MIARELYQHQNTLLGYCRKTQHPALFVEMRLGKTLVALRAMAERKTQRRPYHALVAAPTSALASWEKDATLEGWRVFWLTGTKTQRWTALCDAFDAEDGRVLCLINKEGWIALPDIARPTWDAVIADESTFLKNPTAKVTKFFCRNFRNVPSRFVLTGTPCPEGEHEYFGQLAFLRGGAFGFRDYWHFRQHYMEPNPWGCGWDLKPGAADHIRRIVGQSCAVMRRKDVNLGKVKIYERRTVAFPNPLRKIYNDIERKMRAEWEGGEIRTKWQPVKWTLLRQLCGGFMEEQRVFDGKMDATVELLKTELAREQVVIWCSYNAEVRELTQDLRAASITVGSWTGLVRPAMREITRKQFQAGKLRVLVLQQATAQTGMDLSAASAAIYYSTPPGQMARQQTEDRMLTLAKSDPLLYVDMVVEDSVDEDVLDALDEKTKTSDLSLNRALAAAMRKRTEGKR